MSPLPHYSPSWSSGAFITRAVPVPDLPTQFDELVAACGLTARPDLWQYNEKLRRFARRNRHKKYVPESFLDQLGMDAEAEL